MSKAYVVKANKWVRTEPYSSSNQNSVYVLAKLQLPKGNYLISAQALIYAPDLRYDNYFQNSIAMSLACNGRNDVVYASLNHPIVTRGIVTFNLPVKLEFDSEVNLKARALYRPVDVADAQITALSVDELNISTGNTSNFSNEHVNFHWFNQENGDPFVQNDYMDLKDDRAMDFIAKIGTRFSVKDVKRTWFGRIMDWLSWTNK
jgi:hypothetical protein